MNSVTKYSATDFQTYPYRYSELDLLKIARRIVGEALIYLDNRDLRIGFIAMDLELRFGIHRKTSHAYISKNPQRNMAAKVHDLLLNRQLELMLDR